MLAAFSVMLLFCMLLICAVFVCCAVLCCAVAVGCGCVLCIYLNSYTIITLAIALSSGAAVGLVLRSPEFDPPKTDSLFVDNVSALIAVVWGWFVICGS